MLSSIVSGRSPIVGAQSIVPRQNNALFAMQHRVADIVARAMVEGGYWSGQSEEFIQDQMTVILDQFDHFTRTNQRMDINRLACTSANLSLYCPEVSINDIKLYAAFLGYKLELDPSNLEPNKRYTKITGTYTPAMLVQSAIKASAALDAK